MSDSIDIATVARLTGLTSRALRFYEARGLVKPLRSASGRRYYGPVELERVHQIVTLKRAGLSLADIARLTAHRPVDLAELVRAQIADFTMQAEKLRETRALLATILSRIERSEPIDVATFCSLIQSGETTMNAQSEAWKTITDKYMSEEAKADFAATMPDMPADFDPAAYQAQWKELASRVKAAQPLDPASDAALALVREWFALLAPFTSVATPAMWEGTQTMYSDMGSWQGGDADPGFDAEVWSFMQKATVAARKAGHDIGTMPAWMQK